jgi:two-component system cell cycle response regulator CtrA
MEDKMDIFLLTRNSELAQSVGLMLADPELGYRLGVHDSVSAVHPVGDRMGVVMIDAELPATECMALLERHDRDLSSHAMIVIVGPGLADRPLPGFEGVRHLVMPFHKKDLLTSIQAEALANRNGSQVLRVGRLTLNMALGKAFVDDQQVPLTRKEYEVLQLLAMRRGVTLSKEMFLDKLYGGLDEPEVKIIDVFVCKIRGKIKKLTGGDNLIDTVWGRGYVLRDPDARQVEEGEARRAAG